MRSKKDRKPSRVTQAIKNLKNNEDYKKITVDSTIKQVLLKALRDSFLYAIILVIINLVFVSKIDFWKLTIVQQITLVITSYVVALIIMTFVGFVFGLVERGYTRRKATARGKKA